MRLALALGKFPGEIDHMPYADYIELMEFYEIEPWGLAVADALQANGAALLANVNRDAEKRSEPYSVKDFMLFKPVKKPEPEALVDGKTAAHWRMIFAAETLQAVNLKNDIKQE